MHATVHPIHGFRYRSIQAAWMPQFPLQLKLTAWPHIGTTGRYESFIISSSDPSWTHPHPANSYYGRQRPSSESSCQMALGYTLPSLVHKISHFQPVISPTGGCIRVGRSTVSSFCRWLASGAFQLGPNQLNSLDDDQPKRLPRLALTELIGRSPLSSTSSPCHLRVSEICSTSAQQIYSYFWFPVYRNDSLSVSPKVEL
ncbi:hypothetical protein BDV38DRAFT_144014 [Aspergillus pseudotamarii]|uniref:Uncharacterized protein n=1 Tax=Aspergillus pseudotamarii TaxID=132259 RepID=A0A5N6SNS1_ASPPS|nr:uncharacterized protein BDV38DRAFT_144014 [Aspergillus pseudotamarii]KAE8135013.1 hypothetical protein BDV38DRAFT_144014 [Aspergillus pseudotamarii]